MQRALLASTALFALAGAGCFVLFKDPEGTGGAGGAATASVSTQASVTSVDAATGSSNGATDAASVASVSVASSTGTGCAANTQIDPQNCGQCGHVCQDTNVCTAGACDRNVFITPNDTLFDAAIGGTAGADNICQKAATKAGLVGQYAAWVSLPMDDAIDRIFASDPTHAGRIVNQGQLVANDVASMQNGLVAPINRDPSGSSYGGANVLTNTGPDGRSLPSGCGGLLSTSGASACMGVLLKSSPAWTNTAPSCGFACGAKIYQLYCFEK